MSALLQSRFLLPRSFLCNLLASHQRRNPIPFSFLDPDRVCTNTLCLLFLGRCTLATIQLAPQSINSFSLVTCRSAAQHHSTNPQVNHHQSQQHHIATTTHPAPLVSWPADNSPAPSPAAPHHLPATAAEPHRISAPAPCLPFCMARPRARFRLAALPRAPVPSVQLVRVSLPGACSTVIP